MQKIIIPMIIFLIHMYLWGSDAVFLWRYPHISTRTNFRIGRLKSTSGRSKLLKIIIGLILFPIHKYLWGTDAVFLWRYPHISLYLSANAFVFQDGISLELEVKFDFWKRQNLSEFDARMWCYISLWTWPSGRWSVFVELDMCECDVLFLSDGHRYIAIDPALLLIEAHFEGLLMFDTLFHLSAIPVRLPGCLFF